MMQRLLLALIEWYRRYLSPMKRPTCRFLPTCSEYAQEAIAVHGAWRGTILAVLRLLRCQPFCRAGYDPVPAPRGSRACEAEKVRL